MTPRAQRGAPHKHTTVMSRHYPYHVYITTNQHETVLYAGVTNNLSRRLQEHQADAVYQGAHFAGQNQAFYLIYAEPFTDIREAIAGEKQIKGWRRSKKLDLIHSVNPELKFLNSEV